MAYKPYSDSTLMSMTKPQIIEVLRIAENNYFTASEMLNQQAENMKDWRPIRHAGVRESRWYDGYGDAGQCLSCGQENLLGANYCNHCGAKLDLGIEYDKD